MDPEFLRELRSRREKRPAERLRRNAASKPAEPPRYGEVYFEAMRIISREADQTGQRSPKSGTQRKTRLNLTG